MKSLFIRTIAILLVGVTLLFALPTTTQSAAQPVKVDLTNIDGTAATAWSINNMIPGSSGSKSVVLTNSGSGPGSVDIWVASISGTEGTPSDFGFTATPGGDLQNNLILSVSGTGLSSNFTMPAKLSAFPQSNSSARYLKVSSLGPGSSINLSWNWSLPYSTGNEAQGDSLSFDIKYSLTEIPGSTEVPGGGDPIIAPPTTTTPAPTLAVPTPTQAEPTPTPAVPTPVQPIPTTGVPGGGTAIRTIELDVTKNKAVTGVTDTGIVVGNLSSSTADKKFSLSIGEGTQVNISNESRPDVLPRDLAEKMVPTKIEVIVKTRDIPPYPDGWYPVSPPYDINGVTEGIPHGIKLDKPALMVIEYEEDQLPKVVDGLAVFYYDYENGWTQLEPPAGYVAEAGEAAAEVEHFSLFVVLARSGGAAVGAPAKFDIQRLNVSPARIMVGQSSDVKITVGNTGGMVGEYIVTVKVDNKVQKTQSVKLKPGQRQEIDFTLSPGEVGTYTIQVGNIKGTLTVDPKPDMDLIETDYWWLLFIAAGIGTLFMSLFRLKRPKVQKVAEK